MAVPKKRTSKSRRNMRRSHHGLVAKNTIICPNCADPMLPHKACGSCGQYKGRSVLQTTKGTEGAGEGAAAES